MDFGSPYDTFQAMTRAELAETSPRSFKSNTRVPRAEIRYGQPQSSWDSPGLVSPPGQAHEPPQNAA